MDCLKSTPLRPYINGAEQLTWLEWNLLPPPMNSAESAQVRLFDYLYWASITVYIYDYLLTLPDEIRYVWGRPNRVYFYLNRYTIVAGHIALYAAKHHLPPEKCGIARIVRSLFLVIAEGIVSVILATRTYALYNGDRRVMGFAIGFLVIIAAASFIPYYLVQTDTSPSRHFPGCLSNPRGLIASAVLAVPFQGLCLYDATIFMLTVLKTRSARKANSRIGGTATRQLMPLRTLILKDGAVYFAFITIINASNVVVSYAAPPLLKSSLSAISISAAATLMSRMLLNMYTLGAQQMRGAATEADSQGADLPNLEFADSSPAERDNPGDSVP